MITPLILLVLLAMPPLPQTVVPTTPILSPKHAETMASLGAPMVKAAVVSQPSFVITGFAITNLSVGGGNVSLQWREGRPLFQVQASSLDGSWSNIAGLTAARTSAFAERPQHFFRIVQSNSLPVTINSNSQPRVQWTVPTLDMSDTLQPFTVKRGTGNDGVTFPDTVSGSPVPASGPYQINDTTAVPANGLQYQVLETTANGVVIPYNVGPINTPTSVPGSSISAFKIETSTNTRSVSIQSVAVDSSGNYYIMVLYQGNVSFGGYTLTPPQGKNSMFIARLRPDFSVVWLKDIGCAYSTPDFNPGNAKDLNLFKVAVHSTGLLVSFGIKTDSYANLAIGEARTRVIYSSHTINNYGGIVLAKYSLTDGTYLSHIQARITNPTAGSGVFAIAADGTLWAMGDFNLPTYFGPRSGPAPLTVVFTDMSLSTDSGGNPVTSWDWDFGDGTAHSTLQNPTHTYAAAGTYTVTLIATRAAGGTVRTKSASVTVTSGAPPTVVPEFTMLPNGSAIAGTSIQFTDTSDGGPTSWDWNFGDASPHSSLQNPAHTYAAQGQYTVTLTIGAVVSTQTVNITAAADNLVARFDFYLSVLSPLGLRATTWLSKLDPTTLRPMAGYPKLFGGAGSGPNVTSQCLAYDPVGLGVVAAFGLEGTADFGGTSKTAVGGRGMVIAKYNSSASLQWANEYDSSNNIQPLAIAINGAGRIAITGSFNGTTTFGGPGPAQTGLSDSAFYATYNPNGSSLKAEVMGQIYSDDQTHGNGISIDNSGRIYIAAQALKVQDFGGGIEVPPSGGPLVTDPVVLSYDPSGNPSYRWDHRYFAVASSSSGSICTCCVLNPAQNILFVGGKFFASRDFGTNAGVLTEALPGNSAAFGVTINP